MRIKPYKIFILIFIITSFISSFFPTEWNYGFNHLRYFNIFFRITFLVIGLSLLSDKTINLFAKQFEKFIKFIHSKQKLKVLPIILFLTSLIVFWNFKSRILYGDGGDILRDFETGKIVVTSALAYILGHIGGTAFGWSAFKSITVSSSVAGAVYILYCHFISKDIYKESDKQILLFLLLTTIGSMQLFFGLIEFTPWLATSIIIYVYYANRYLQGKNSIIPAAIFIALTISVHLTGIVLLPSLAYLIYYRKNNKIFQDLTKAIIAFALVIFIVSSYIYIVEWDRSIPENRAEKMGRLGIGGWDARFYPLFEIKYPEDQHATMFSKYHLNQIFNEHLLIAPIGIFLFFRYIKNYRIFSKPNYFNSITGFLTLNSIFYLTYTSTAIMAFSGRQDWDAFAPVAIIYTLLGAMYLLNEKEYKQIAISLIILAILHVVPWIVSNYLGLPRQPSSLILSNL